MENQKNPNRWLWPLSFAALVFSHVVWIRVAPGFQSDEGFYANLARKIAFEPGFWPVRGQLSPYTTTLDKYLPAAFFRLLGPTLAAYRFSGVLEVVLGVLLLCAGLVIASERRAAALLGLVLAFFPAAVINERWVVESTTFQVLTWGAVCLGLALRWKRGPSWGAALWIIAGTAFGIMAHLGFLAPILTLWLCLFSTRKIESRVDRWTIALCGVCLLPFFAFIALTLGKEFRLNSIALLAMVISIVLIQAVPARARAALTWLSRWALLVMAFISSVLLIPFALFSEGNWQAATSNGYVAHPALIGWFFVPLVWIGWSARASIRKVPIEVWCFLPVSLLFTYVMAIKVGPRYLEIQFLVLALGIALALARLRPALLVPGLVMWVLQGSLVLGLNYFQPAVQNKQIQATIRFWRWRDASDGFLPKVVVLDWLAEQGCNYQDISQIGDTSMGEALMFFSQGEWPQPASGGCQLGHHVRIIKQADMSTPPAGAHSVGAYWIVGSEG